MNKILQEILKERKLEQLDEGDSNNHANIKYGKKLSVVADKKITVHNISAMDMLLAKYDSVKIQLGNNVIKKTEKLLKKNNFKYTIDPEWGFDWESRITGEK